MNGKQLPRKKRITLLCGGFCAEGKCGEQALCGDVEEKLSII